MEHLNYLQDEDAQGTQDGMSNILDWITNAIGMDTIEERDGNLVEEATLRNDKYEWMDWDNYLGHHTPATPVRREGDTADQPADGNAKTQPDDTIDWALQAIDGLQKSVRDLSDGYLTRAHEQDEEIARLGKMVEAQQKEIQALTRRGKSTTPEATTLTRPTRTSQRVAKQTAAQQAKKLEERRTKRNAYSRKWYARKRTEIAEEKAKHTVTGTIRVSKQKPHGRKIA